MKANTELYQAVQVRTAVCNLCAGAFGVEDAVDDTGVVTFDENVSHPSGRSLVDDGYEVITFRSEAFRLVDVPGCTRLKIPEPCWDRDS